MKVSLKLFFSIVAVFFILAGCAGMDVRVDSMPGSAYRAYKPRIPFEKMRVFDEKPSEQHVIVGRYIAQETQEVIISRSMREMTAVAAEKAWKDGADAIVMGDYDTRKVTGYRRDTGVVRITGIRFYPLE